MVATPAQNAEPEQRPPPRLERVPIGMHALVGLDAQIAG
jgi:hypothetical protein